jgi:serine/threonine protein phosphatase 1
MSNNIEDYFIIGDVHGCFNTLMKLLKQLPQDAKLIFVGDLCDKGNFSKEVIEFVMHNHHQCIYGNHEYLFYNYARDAIKRDIHAIWSKNKAYGGMKTVNNYINEPDLVEKHCQWIETLPHYLEIGNYFITHGFGLPYYKRKDETTSKHKILVNRVDVDKYKDDWEETTSYSVINIFGHCKFKEVLEGKNYYGIDTGCVYGNKLTAFQLGTHKLFHETLDIKDIAEIKYTKFDTPKILA